MAKNYGYIAKIGADTSGMADSLKDLENKAKSLQAELRTIRFDVNNGGGAVALQQQYDVVTQAIETTRQKLAQLEAAQEAVNNAFQSGQITESQYRSFQRDVETTTNSLQSYERELDRVQNTINSADRQTEQLRDTTNRFENAANDASESVVNFGDLLGANILGDVIADGLQKAADAIVDFAKQGVDLASDLTEVQNVVDVTFGDGAEKIYEWSKTAAESFGMSALSAQQYAGTMGAMLKSSGLAEQEILQMSTDLSGLAGDMASFYNLDTQAAFDKLRAGISGETEPLKQLGINMSVVNMEAFALSQGIDKSWNSMSQAEQATLRYQYIMDAASDSQGDFARTSDSFANQQRILELNLQNLSAQLGSKLLPILNETIQKINDFITSGDTDFEKLFADIASGFEKVVSILTNVTEFFIKYRGVIATVTAGTVAFVAAMKTVTAIQTAKTAITGLIAALKGAEVAQTGLNVAMAANPVGLLVAGITALVAVISVLVASADSAAEKFKELTDKAKESAEQVTDLKGKLEEVNQKITDIQGKGTLTLVEQEQLDNLKQTSTELEYQLLLAEKQSKLDAQKLEEKSLDNIYKAVDQDQAIEGLQEDIQYANDLQAKLKEVKADWKAAVDAGDTDKAEELNNQIYTLNEQLTNVEQEILDTGNQFETWRSGLSGFSSDCEYAEEKSKEVADSVSEYFQSVTAAIPAELKTAAEYEAESAKSNAENLARETEAGLQKYRDKQLKADEELQKKLDNLEKDYNKHKIVKADGTKDEEEYYRRRKDILENSTNKETELWWKYYDEIADYQENANNDRLKDIEKQADKEQKAIEKQNKEQLSAWEKHTDELGKTLEKAYDDLADDKAKAKEKLLDIDLAETIKDNKGNNLTVLNDLSAQTDKMEEFQKSIEKLKKTGISDSLLAEIDKMDYSNGDQQNYVNALLALKPKNLQQYYNDWDEYQATATIVSDSMFTEQEDELNKKAAQATDDILKSMPEIAYKDGQETAKNYMQGVIDGMTGVGSSADISGVINGAIGKSGATAQQKMVLASTPITINVDGKKYVETTIGELIEGNKLTGGNNLNI